MNYDDLYKRDSSPKDRNVSAIFSLVNYIVQFSQMIYMILYTYIYIYRGLTWSTIKDIYIHIRIYIYTFKLMHECRWLIGEEKVRSDLLGINPSFSQDTFFQQAVLGDESSPRGSSRAEKSIEVGRSLMTSMTSIDFEGSKLSDAEIRCSGWWLGFLFGRQVSDQWIS